MAKEYVSLLKSDVRTSSLVISMEKILTAYIDLANAPIEGLAKTHNNNTCKGATLAEFGGTIWQTFSVAGSSSNSGSASSAASSRQLSSASASDDVCSILTVSHPLQSDKNYSSIKRILKFQNNFTVTETGNSKPKIIKLMGNDGRMYTQLVKGGDDTRQDAVMQQVFEYVNYSFGRVEDARKRRLTIRCYKVVPTSPQTGILEWVENTRAFGSIISDRDGTHNRYRPKDLTYKDAKERLKISSNQNASKAKMLQTYEEVCRNFKPSFRFFFLEKFADPMEWNSRRLQYTRSVATTSMVGYILGIGDRHCHNILVDNATADVVHIDFGMVFEQGRLLPLPERTPFRLTREVVDGMGVSACEGAFRRSSEEVLKVLREFAGQLITILEVVIHDPLFRWCMSPMDAKKKQTKTKKSSAAKTKAKAKSVEVSTIKSAATPNKRLSAAAAKKAADIDEDNNNNDDDDDDDDDNDNDDDGGYEYGGSATLPAVPTPTPMVDDRAGKSVHDAAARALAKIMEKLKGLEDPVGEPFSVDGHVAYLIEQATSNENLSQMYYGWSAWL